MDVAMIAARRLLGAAHGSIFGRREDGGGNIRMIDGGGIIVEDRLGEGLAFPDGWRATALDPLRIAANGICQPGRLRVEGGGTAEEWTLAAPDCRVDPAP